MQQSERLTLIMAQLQQQTSLTLKEIMTLTGASRDTTRRDIVKLSQTDAVVRNYGGISLPHTFQRIDDFLTRQADTPNIKRQIAKAAATLATDQTRLFLDTSTTISLIPPFLPANDQTFAVTNSLDIGDQLLRKTACRTQLLGGHYLSERRGTMDTTALRELYAFNFDVTFISAAGLTTSGVYYAYLEDRDFKQQLRHQSQTVVLVLDHQRCGISHNFCGLQLEQLDYLVTDTPLEPGLAQALANAQVTVIVTEEE